MEAPATLELTSRYGMRTEEFSALMKHRVLDILLVASEYDSFVLEEDGQLTELLFEEYRNLDLNLRYAPRFVRASGGAEALAILASRSVDMVVTTPRLSDMRVGDLVRTIRSERPQLPVGMLAAHAWDLPWLEDLRISGILDWIFLWQGNVKALLAMIKQVEDRQNADHDILEGGVQAIILVEDEVRFYSSYLANIYTEITTQTARLMVEGINLSHRLLRIRARPKILLAQSYEQAWELYERYADNVLGIISDVSFPRDGALDRTAGLALARAVRERDAELPILLQSLDTGHREAAAAAGTSFLSKTSPNLLEELRRFILDHFGFGDFIFRSPAGETLTRVADLRAMLEALPSVPEESLLFHASRNHFSSWLKARTEFELASAIRPRTVSEFAGPGELRAFLIATFTSYLREIQAHVITDFDPARFDHLAAFAKIGAGSLGGKGRGLAFMHKLLAHEGVAVPGVDVGIPQTTVLSTEVFDEMVAGNGLRDLVHDAPEMSDHQILDRFRGARFPAAIRADLARLLEVVHEPLAVRSSSLLEDSVYQPFAGVYATVMLPNTHPSLDVRLAQLLEAVKVVYASTYFRQARTYLESTPYRIEEEAMAVLVQRLVGSRRGDRFYPTVSGVASSYNFYPFRDMQPEDGVGQIALGLGKSVVEGFGALRFCPRHPLVLPQFSAIKDVLRNAQRRFYALDMSRDDTIPGVVTDANLVRAEIREAVEDGAAWPVASTYSRADDSLSDGLSERGVPVITFASLLRGRTLPLPQVLTRLLEVCQSGIGNPVEIEFAADLVKGLGRRQSFNVLQVRPLVLEDVNTEVVLDEAGADAALVRSDAALGHGRRETISDLVVINPARFKRSWTVRAAAAIETINRNLRRDNRHCILIGPGRWGSRDPWLGIPVAWGQISSARAIVETDFADLQVEPSLGSHFFHNLTSFGIAFFAVHSTGTGGSIDWEWFARQPAESEHVEGALRHIRLTHPLQVVVDGASGRGVILEGNEGRDF